MEEIIIAIDTEFESSNMINGNCIQLGFVAIIAKPNFEITDDSEWLIETLDLCFEDQDDKLKEKNVMEFWNKFPEVRERIRSNSKPIGEQMIKLQLWLNDLSDRYIIKGFVADHSCVDFGWFRNLFLTHCDQLKSRFNLPYKCFCTFNIVEVLKSLGYSNEYLTEYCNNEKYPHTHYAVEDAIQTSYEYLRLQQIIKRNCIDF